MRLASSLRQILGQDNSDSSISHRAFVLHARPQSTDDSKDTTFLIHYKSYITQDVFEQALLRGSWGDLQEVLLVTSEHSQAHSLEGNMFEAVVHNILPGIENLDICLMTKGAKQGDFYTYKLGESPQSLSVNFRRSFRHKFTTSVPPQIDLQNYYQGSRTTPLIDGFIVRQGTRNVELYLIQITVTQYKKNRSASGKALVDAIAAKVTARFATKSKPLRIFFVMIQPTFHDKARALHTDLSPAWQLPISTEPYRVYHCYLGLPTVAPAPFVTVESLLPAPVVAVEPSATAE